MLGASGVLLAPRFGIGESPSSVNTDENWLLRTSAFNRLFELCLTLCPNWVYSSFPGAFNALFRNLNCFRINFFFPVVRGTLLLFEDVDRIFPLADSRCQ